MRRTTLAVLGGALLGLIVAGSLLQLTFVFLRWQTAPRVFAIDHQVVYLSMVLGVGFGGLCGGLIGLAGVLTRQAAPSAPDRTPPPDSASDRL